MGIARSAARYALAHRTVPPMTLNQSAAYRTFKYAVYLLLVANIYLFWQEEWAALAHRFADGLAVADIIEGFAATIDTAAWVGLLLAFEIQTGVLEERQLTPRVSRALQGFRAICYAFVVYAFWGYATKLSYLYGASSMPLDSDLCRLAVSGWSYAIDLDEYVTLTAANCGQLDAQGLIRFTGLTAVVDSGGYRNILRLAWLDLINSGTWLTVVALLEAEVQLQNRQRLSAALFRTANGTKVLLYGILFSAAVYWSVKGDFVDFWDAFLWLVAFFFIERNVVEWRAHDLRAPAATATA